MSKKSIEEIAGHIIVNGHHGHAVHPSKHSWKDSEWSQAQTVTMEENSRIIFHEFQNFFEDFVVVENRTKKTSEVRQGNAKRW